MGRENKRPPLAQDPCALVSPPPHLAPNVAAKGFQTGLLHAGRKTRRDLRQPAFISPIPRNSPTPGCGAAPYPRQPRVVPGASPAAGFRPNCARTRHERIWRQKEFRGKRVTPRTAFHKLPRAEEGGAYSSPLCLALRRGPGLSLACSVGGKHTGLGIVYWSQTDRRCRTWKRGQNPLLENGMRLQDLAPPRAFFFF